MLLDSHAGGRQGAGDGADTHIGGCHQDWEDDGYSKFGFVGLLSSSTHPMCPGGVSHENNISCLLVVGVLSDPHEAKESPQYPDSSDD